MSAHSLTELIFFTGCRVVSGSVNGRVISFTFPMEQSVAYPLHFNCAMTRQDATKKMVSDHFICCVPTQSNVFWQEALAVLLHPIFQQEQAHQQQANVIY